jgi:hypothetical protein
MAALPGFGMSVITKDVDPCRHRARGLSMDLPVFLALAVLLLVALCVYVLVNDVPRRGAAGARRRR